MMTKGLTSSYGERVLPFLQYGGDLCLDGLHSLACIADAVRILLDVLENGVRGPHPDVRTHEGFLKLREKAAVDGLRPFEYRGYPVHKALVSL